ncbi:MAG: GAF domain-containing protein [Bacteroidales bacterium]|nr:GAF domain-containing protein [Bacteroidales bacterium]
MFKKNTTKTQFAKIIAINALFLLLIAAYAFAFFQWHLKNDNTLKNLYLLKDNLADIKNLQNNFINKNYFDELFFDTGENKYTKQLSNKFDKITNNLENLRSVNSWYNDSETQLLYDNILDNVQSLRISNNLLLKYLKEAGNERSGIYSHLLLTEKSCEEKFANLNGITKTKNYFKQAKNYRKIFYSYSDLQLLNMINNSINASIQTLEKNYQLSGNYKYLRLIDQLNEYKKVFNQYARKILQIGVNEHQGIRMNMNGNYKKIDIRINKISTKLQALQIKANRLFALIIILLLFANIALSFYFHNKTAKQFGDFVIASENYFKSWLSGVKARAPAVLPNDDYQELQKLMNDFSEKLNLSVQMLKALMRSDAKLLNEENFDKVIFSEIKAVDKHIRNLNRQLKAETNATLVNEWIRKGLTGFSEVLRKNFDEPAKHAKEILSNLVAYLNVPMGAIYLPSSEKRNTFDLVGSIAFGKEKHYVRSVMLGEGIVGTVALERKTLNITDIPEDYFKVSSGFCEVKPKIIIVIPINLENKVFGIIELASLQKFQHFELEFIDELSKTLGASFAISRIFRNTRNKLEKAENKVMSLRRDNKESNVTILQLEKEKLQLENIKKENELLVQGIDTLMLVAELDLDGNILEMNNAFVELFKKSKDILLHTNYWDYTFMRETIEEDIALDKIKNSLRIGKMHTLEQHFQIVQKNIALSSIFIPLKDIKGKVFKIKVLAWNNTNLLNIQTEMEQLQKQLQEFRKEKEKEQFKAEELERTLKEKDQEIANIRKLYEEEIKKIKSEHLKIFAKTMDEQKKKENVLFDEIDKLRKEIEQLKK